MQKGLNGLKEIADYITAQTGWEFSRKAAGCAAARGFDPLPVEWFNGRVKARKEDIDAWIQRQRRPRSKKLAS